MPLGLPEGGSATYVGNPWRVVTVPVGVPSCKVPETQSLQGIEAAISQRRIELRGSKGVVQKWRLYSIMF